MEGVTGFDSVLHLESSILRGVEVEIVSGMWTLCMLTVGLGEIGGGVTLDLIERDLFGGNAGGRPELQTTSLIEGVVVTEMLSRNKRDVYLF